MTYAELARLMAVLDEKRSPESRTVIYRAFVAHMFFLVDQTVARWCDSQGTVPPDVVKFWLDAYREAEPSEPTTPDWRRIYTGLIMYAFLADEYPEHSSDGVVADAVNMADDMLAALAEKSEPTEDDTELRQRYARQAYKNSEKLGLFRIPEDPAVEIAAYPKGAWVQAQVWVDKSGLPSEEG